MNNEVYVVRLCSNNGLVNRVIAVIKNIDVIDKIIYNLFETEGYKFETLASNWTNRYWRFNCLNYEDNFLRVDKTEIIE